jgi:hypothetical protein
VRCVVHAAAARAAARAGSRARGEPKALIDEGAKPFDVAVALVRALRAIAPSALIIEDLHWADEATLDVVRLLARHAEDAGLLLVLSYRSDQLHRDHPLRIVLGELPTGDAVTRLELSTLSPEAVGELATEAGLDGLELYARTGRIVAGAERSGCGTAGDGRWVAMLLAAASATIGLGVLYGWRPRACLATQIALAVLYWILGQGLGGVLTGRATDVGTAPLMVVIALMVPPAGRAEMGLRDRSPLIGSPP